LCTTASLRGVPVYALAGGEKVLPAADAARLQDADAPPGEVWPDPPERVQVRNPYFERIPASVISMLVTDTGARSI
jgi:translation initiation factor 2B subunit (eIF-2B alpha/beta/delta family)